MFPELVRVDTDSVAQTVATGDSYSATVAATPDELVVAVISVVNATGVYGLDFKVLLNGVETPRSFVNSFDAANNFLYFGFRGLEVGDCDIEIQISGIGIAQASVLRGQYLVWTGVDPADDGLGTAGDGIVDSINPLALTASPPDRGAVMVVIGATQSTALAPQSPSFSPSGLQTNVQEPVLVSSVSDEVSQVTTVSFITGLRGAHEFVIATSEDDNVPFALTVFAFTGDVLCERVNCECDEENDNLTLAGYRSKLLIRTGFAAVASNPPPGTAALFNSFLQDAQDFLYKKYPALNTRRFFKWGLLEGERFYGLREDDKDGCEVNLDPYKNIEGAWLIDLNGQWLPMTCGIPPSFYTTMCNPAIPFRYEIRQCIEIFPAPPADGYTLAIKGHFGKRPFTAEDDKPTIDGNLVYLWALANALDYYGKPAAAGIATQANDYLGQLVAGTHTGKRYIPGTRPANPAIMPVYAPWPGEY